MRTMKLNNIALALSISFSLFFVWTSCSPVKVVNSNDGFEPIFDGSTLNGWEGDPVYWRVENGALVGEVTPSTLLQRNSFIVWNNGLTRDFEFKAEYRVTNEGNSGINYRSEPVEGVPYALVGYQCDIDGQNNYTGMNYEERRRTTIAKPGQKVMLKTPDSSTLSDNIKNNTWLSAKETGLTGNLTELKSQIKSNEWNVVHIIVKGNKMQHFINGNLMSEVIDKDQINSRKEGLLGVQVHVGPPMKIEYRNMMIKHTK